MELLAPAGNREALVAAVQNGADAVYLGAGAFNARAGAGNFDADGLFEAVRYCHLRGAKVHVTLNTLVREDEMDALAETAEVICRSGADAVIVQDLGVAAVLREIAPDMALHASTQMAVHNAQGARLLKERGFDRVVLAREMDFHEIAECAGTGVEIEAFVHGALCVAASGQCLFSSLVGGRSGNRGQCAQPCRLGYEFMGKKGCLLSTKDLMGLGQLARYRDAGVKSLKIEGRLKRPEYVAVTTRVYREALDRLQAEGAEAPDLKSEAALRQMFNRGGFTQGYGPGARETELMYSERANNLGVAVGACRRPGTVLLEQDVEAEDALALRGAGEDLPVRVQGAAGSNIACPGARAGDRLFRTVSERQMRAARESSAGENRPIVVNGEVTLRVGAPAEMRVREADGPGSAHVFGETVQPARKQPMDGQRVAEQVKSTGGTPFRFAEIQLDMDDNAFLPVSAIKALRRDALSTLEAARLGEPRRVYPISAVKIPEAAYPERPEILVQSGDPAVLMAALDAGADGLLLAPEDAREAALDKALAAMGGEPFFLVPPPVLAGRDLAGLNRWANACGERIRGVYITNIGQLGLSWPGELRCGFMPGIMNRRALAFYLDRGISRYMPSLEMTAKQIRAIGGARELMVYGRAPLMWLRHCPLRAALGLPGAHVDCRRCDESGPEAALSGKRMRDRVGKEFPLRRFAGDGGCVILLQNADRHNLIRRLSQLPPAMAWHLMPEDEADARCAVKAFRDAALGRPAAEGPLWDQSDYTTGHYFRGV